MGPMNANVPSEFKRGERLSAGKLNQIVQAIVGLLRSKHGFGVERPLNIIGKLDGDLVAATNFGTAPSTATLSVWTKNSSGNLVDSGRNETVVNRFLYLGTISSGTIVKAEWLEGEWQPYAIDCEP